MTLSLYTLPRALSLQVSSPPFDVPQAALNGTPKTGPAHLSPGNHKKPPGWGGGGGRGGRRRISREILWDESSQEGFEYIIQCSWIPSLVLKMLCFIPKNSASSYRHWISSISLMAQFKLFFPFPSGTSLISLPPLTKTSKPGKENIREEKRTAPLV